MFDFFFKYPAAAFSKGTFVLLGPAPAWVLALVAIVTVAALGFAIRSRRHRLAPAIHGMRMGILWLLEAAFISLLLLLLWQPAMSVAELKPQQNIVAVVVDDSRSMAIKEGGSSRIEAAVSVLQSGLIERLQDKFQVQLYRFGGVLERIQRPDRLSGSAPASRIGAALQDLLADTATLPIGAIVLLSDGSGTSGGIDPETVASICRKHIPVHTIGFGREQFDRDIELTGVQLPSHVLPDSLLQAQITVRQQGYEGQRARVSASEGEKILGSREILLAKNVQIEPLIFVSGNAGVKNVEFAIQPLEGERNRDNNRLTRVIDVDAAKPRILYVEGEPRWDYKFIRRAIEDDGSLQIASILRTTQNKIYVQDEQGGDAELRNGFPNEVEQLFQYDGILLGSIEAGYFTPAQQELMHQFVDRRGGGLLFMGGRESLADGGYTKAPFAGMLPVELPGHRDTFHRDRAYPELSPAGRDSLICRLVEDPDKNAARWKELPYLMNYQEPGVPKPAATVLAEMTAGGKKMPLLVTQNYGRGRTAVFSTGGDWRWKMLQPADDRTHAIFWRQLLRWLVNDTPTRVTASTRHPVLFDDGHVRLRAEVRDTTYLPSSDAQVEARIADPAGTFQTIPFQADPAEPGSYNAEWSADKAGTYVAEVAARRGQQELGRHIVTFRRENGVAENFHQEQNRELLEKLAAQTGGRYYRPQEAGNLPRDISYSEAGIAVRETKDLWDMPAVFLVALMLRSTEWLLRRRWGAV